MYKLKNNYKEWYQPQHSFVVRNPLFSLENFFNWKSETSNNVSLRKEELREYLRRFYQQPIAQEALYVGSPDLHEQLQLWLDNKIDKPDKKEKTELSLVKYMIRMCTRCTPYGLFASCTAGNFSEESSIQLSEKKSLQRHGRLDMDYVCELHAHLLKQKEIRDQLLYYPNTSLYRAGEQWRYVEHRFQKEKGRSYHIVEVNHSEYLSKIILAATVGCTTGELAAIIADSEISNEEAKDFIYELINNQVLVDELQPSVTGEEYFSVVLRKLKTLKHTGKYIEHLEKVFQKFDLLKETEAIEKNELYHEIVRELQQLEVPLHLKTLIQVDSYRPASCTLNKKINDELLKGASLLQLLSRDQTAKDAFADFKTAFINRYEGQWVSLAEVLDTESGIGYGKFASGGMEESPLIDHLPIGNTEEIHSGQNQATAESFKWQLYHEAVSKNKTEVQIEETFIETVMKKEQGFAGLPDSICMMAKINAGSAEDIDKGNFTIILHPPSGPSGANLLGRFCHLHPDFEKLTRSVLEEEEAHRPDAAFAEIVHLPESRIGNILMRPVLRKYEIAYLCGTPLDKESQIPVSDLLVGIEANRVVLRSKRLNKEIIPRLTTAHNFNLTTLPVYQFLCDLQFQNISSPGWHWGVLENHSFLPRVSYGKFILSKARWTITKNDVKEFDQKNDEKLQQQFTRLREIKNLPEDILLSQGDNELMLHLENIFCLKLLLAEINKSETVILTESFDTPGNCWIKSPDGHHAGEFIFTFSKKLKEPIQNGFSPVNTLSEKSITRFFPVGTEWLYAKIYCGTKTAEKILAEIIKPFTEEILSRKIIDKYFFVRYHDTGNHIRIRFHKAGRADFWKRIMQGLQELLHPFLATHQVYNVQYETYQREAERYGFDTMHLSEEIFYYQSAAVLNFISMLDGDEGEQYRWQTALKAIDLFLDGFHYTTEQKRDLVKNLGKNFAGEFRIKPAEQKKISERFSIHKQMVNRVMNNDWNNNEDLNRAISVFKIEDKNYRQCIEEILSSSSVHHDINQLNRLMPGYLHMFINRLFVSNQRKNELIIYDYLYRFFESRLAREKNTNNIPEPLNAFK